jgi:multicomponent Na+:H+ antiporter subunit D
MTQTQILLLLISLIPLANCLVTKFCDNQSSLIAGIKKLLPVLFLINLFGIYANIDRDNSYLILAEASRGVALGFEVDQISLVFLFLLNFFWLILAFYLRRFFELAQLENVTNLESFLATVIALVNLILISKNLLSILFFYNCLIIICHFFGIKFLHKKETKFSHFFTFLFYLESLFFFLAIVATYKFTGQIDFKLGGIITENIQAAKYFLLLAFYLIGLFLSVLMPFYLLYRDINLDLITIYGLFFLSYAFSGIYILLKILNSIFGFEGFALMLSGAAFTIFEWIFLLNIAVSSICLVLSKGLKSSFFYLFFQQLTFVLFSIFTFAVFNEAKIGLGVLSFFFSMTLIFLSVSNFILYLNKSQSKNVLGIFYDLKVSSALFIFAVLNLMGVAPAIGAVEKFFLLKIIIQKKLLIAGLVFVINFVGLAIFAGKVFYPFFCRNQLQKSQSDQDLAKSIDFDSSLILTGLIVAIAIFLSLIFFPFLLEFL